MEALAGLLTETASEFRSLKDELKESQAFRDEKAAKAAKLRQKLDGMKGEIQDQVNGLFASMMDINPEDVLSEEEITQHLTYLQSGLCYLHFL